MPGVVADVDLTDFDTGALLRDKIHTHVSRGLGREIADGQPAVVADAVIFVAEQRYIVSAVIIIGSVSFRDSLSVCFVPERNREIPGAEF